MHSVADIRDIINQNPDAKPVAEYLPGHAGRGGDYWWNSDIYVSYKNEDGSWSWPQNLGTNINTVHLENAPWVNDDQTKIIFRRDAANDDASISGTYMAVRPDKYSEWGKPVKLTSNIGDNYINHHLTPSGNLYFETTDNQSLYTAQPTGQNTWDDPNALEILNSELMDTQLWINKNETVIYFNRRDNSGKTMLFRSERTGVNSKWEEPEQVNTSGFDSVWGEPGFTDNGRMYFVMGIETYLYSADPDGAGGFGVPEKLVFKE